LLELDKLPVSIARAVSLSSPFLKGQLVYLSPNTVCFV
jgi:hypothetical protein